MACVGLKFVENKLDPWLRDMSYTRRGLNFAMEIMKHANSYTYKAGKTIKMKIGIHYGNCIYGLLGYHKPQFSLIGDTINTTSRYPWLTRHCTTGNPGSIVLSESAHKQLDDHIREMILFEEAKMEMKGKGLVNTYTINLFGSEKNIKKPLTVHHPEPNSQNSNLTNMLVMVRLPHPEKRACPQAVLQAVLSPVQS